MIIHRCLWALLAAFTLFVGSQVFGRPREIHATFGCSHDMTVGLGLKNPSDVAQQVAVEFNITDNLCASNKLRFLNWTNHTGSDAIATSITATTSTCDTSPNLCVDNTSMPRRAVFGTEATPKTIPAHGGQHISLSIDGCNSIDQVGDKRHCEVTIKVTNNDGYLIGGINTVTDWGSFPVQLVGGRPF
ncbi:MAG: hypothetical protein HY537_17185 [Deltaproteobacteria bacterium]|nr:hypothetical protein [Deltaproteobacteria bacterium]